MRAHLVVNGVVVNTIIVDSLDALPSTTLVDADTHGGGIGWIWDGEVLTPPSGPTTPQTTQRQLTSLEFLDLFTESEQLAVAQAALKSAHIKLWYDRLLAASFITLADPRTETGLNHLTTAGLLTPERKDEIVGLMR